MTLLKCDEFMTTPRLDWLQIDDFLTSFWWGDEFLTSFWLPDEFMMSLWLVFDYLTSLWLPKIFCVWIERNILWKWHLNLTFFSESFKNKTIFFTPLCWGLVMKQWHFWLWKHSDEIHFLSINDVEKIKEIGEEMT